MFSLLLNLKLCSKKSRVLMVRKISNICMLIVCFVIVSFVPVSTLDSNTEIEDSVSRVTRKINSLLQTSILKDALIGIQIKSLTTGEILYELNPELSLNPASNTKLVTSAVALIQLKPEYQFRTAVYTHAALRNGTLEGNLYLKGGGDPSLSYEDLLSLAQAVYNAGIRTISGDIVGDDSFFDAEREFSGWHDFSRAYSGKLSALALNKSAVRLTITPSSRTGVAPNLVLTPPSSYIQVHNTAVTLNAKNRVYASLKPPEEEQHAGDDLPVAEILDVQGKISPKTRYGVVASVNVNNPSLFTTTTFKDALEKIGIRVEGQAVVGQLQKKSRRLAVHSSDSLARIIQDSNKTSSNFVAEQILKTLGAEVLGAPGTTEKGIQVIQDFLAELGFAPETYVLENGSGLSRNNRLSPEQIVSLLTYMYNNFAIRSEYLASLAVAGVDGTLRRRLRDTGAERRLRAKTGAINRVSCLSGYVVSQDNEVFAFSIMMNEYQSGGYAVKEIQNQIGLLLTEFYRPTYNVRRDAEAEE